LGRTLKDVSKDFILFFRHELFIFPIKHQSLLFMKEHISLEAKLMLYGNGGVGKTTFIHFRQTMSL
jgi:polynucleotide 5'-kinase involved in rRNA processing